MSDLVPIFPLPNVVLLPRAVLPLHIFEPRYKAMTADALAGDGRLAIALLRTGWEKNYYGSPPIEEIICVGEILQHEQLPDGRYNFLLQGLTRARVVREERVGLYRAAEIEQLPAQHGLDIDLLDLRQKLLELFQTALAPHKLATQFAQLLQTIIPTTDAADVIAFHLLDDPREKQLMLEEPDAQRRIDRLIQQLTHLTPPPTAAETTYLNRRMNLN
jgi:Lon protease-like protein